MKKGLFFLVFALSGIFSFGQNVHKGSLIGLHTITFNLKDGVKTEDFTKYFTSKAIPAYEEAFPGLKMYLIRSLRGQDSSSRGVIYMFTSEAVRNKYFNNDGTMTELGKAAGAKLSGIGKELDTYLKPSDAPARYNDWLVE